MHPILRLAFAGAAILVSFAGVDAAVLTVDAKFREVVADDLILLNDLIVSLDSSAAGTTPIISVTGTVTLGGALIVNASGAPFPTGRTYVLIENDGTDAVIGTFAGLAEGSGIASGGQRFRISYTGGTGNDVTLTAFHLAVPALDTIGIAVLALLLGVTAVAALR